MTLYIIIYIISIISSLYGGFTVYRIYKNTFGLFFFIATIFMSLWFIFFFLFFSGITNPEILLFITRICFSVGILASYSLLFGVYLLNKGSKYPSGIKKILFFSFYIFIFCFYTFSDFIVESLQYSPINNIYRENHGKLFFIHLLLYGIFIISFIGISFLKVKNQSYINKLRLKYILYLSYITIFIGLIFQLFLPMLGVWFLERELILFFLGYVLCVVYIIKRYYFSSISSSLGKIFILIISILFSVSFFILGEYFHITINNGFWGFSIPLLYGNTIIGILLYILFYNILSNIFLGKSGKDNLENIIKKLEHNISMITDFRYLNNYLSRDMGKIFKTQFFELQLYKNSHHELKNYFEKDNKYFINDFVFIEENKSKFNKNKILKYISKQAFLIFPIYNNRENIGFLILGKKIFGDFYNATEIKVIQDFIFFLEHHIKYIKSFEKIRDLSLNLDKKVDEKTIEYNNLINKQKEFIAMISHEIRSPVASAIFQADSMLDDIKNNDMSTLPKELEVLNSILLKIGELTTKLFAVQYYDTHHVELYLEHINITHLLKNEIEVHTHIHENIQFIDRVDKNIGFLKIDKIQFKQVVENLISNAVKFIHGKNGIVCVTGYKTQKSLIISVEDNGEGFEGVEVNELFEKYTKGTGDFIGLGMGLYLCKKIISMHKGNIEATFSKEFKGAQFTIEIPIK